MPEPIRPSPITATSRMSPGWITLLDMLMSLSLYVARPAVMRVHPDPRRIRLADG
jgi:hypothetical protein